MTTTEQQIFTDNVADNISETASVTDNKNVKNTTNTNSWNFLQKNENLVKVTFYVRPPNADENNKRRNPKKIKVTRELHGSGGVGSYIRNAVTGAIYPYTVGSNNEKLLYKVVDLHHKYRTTPLVLFYDTPQEYEDHQFVEVGEQEIEAWRERQQLHIRQTVE